MQLPLPFQLPDLAALAQTLAAVPLEKWMGLATGPVLFAASSLIRRFFPSWGEGRFLFSSRLEKKLSLAEYAFVRSPYSLVPLFLSVFPWMHHDYWYAFGMFSTGVSGVLYYWKKGDALRGGIRFLENRFVVNGHRYEYDSILSIEKKDEVYRFKTKKFVFLLTQNEYEKVQPSLRKFGYGESETYRPNLDLK